MNRYVTSPSDLFKAWSIPRSVEQSRQLTIRIQADTYFKIKAIEELFPGRSRNEVVSDLLSTALDQFEESLPFESIDRQYDEHEIEDHIHRYHEPPSSSTYSIDVGPRIDFQNTYRKLKMQEVSDESDSDSDSDNVSKISKEAS